VCFRHPSQHTQRRKGRQGNLWGAAGRCEAGSGGGTMGKNTAHRAMQAQRYTSAGDDAAGDGKEARAAAPASHQEADVTYHTAEWHAARIAALQVGGRAPAAAAHARPGACAPTHSPHAGFRPSPPPPKTTRMSWDDFRKQQREAQAREDALVGSDKALREWGRPARGGGARGARAGARGPAGCRRQLAAAQLWQCPNGTSPPPQRRSPNQASIRPAPFRLPFRRSPCAIGCGARSTAGSARGGGWRGLL
jgi:hypothetical protein